MHGAGRSPDAVKHMALVSQVLSTARFSLDGINSLVERVKYYQFIGFHLPHAVAYGRLCKRCCLLGLAVYPVP